MLATGRTLRTVASDIAAVTTRLPLTVALAVVACTLVALAAPAQASTTCQAGGACAIGDVGPGGGIVFIAPGTTGNSSGKFFEAAPNTWNGSAPDGTAQWCNATNASVAGLGTVIGTGITNSASIATACTSVGTDDAAEYVRSRTIGGLTDWFLPSQDEMLALYGQRAYLTGAYATNQADSDAARYLTSSQQSDYVVGFSNASGAYMQGSGAPGTIALISKAYPFAVRPVRMFTAAVASSVSTAPASPADILQQVGRLHGQVCSSLSLPALDPAGVSGGWQDSWAEWAVPVTGGPVCTRMLHYSARSASWMLI